MSAPTRAPTRYEALTARLGELRRERDHLAADRLANAGRLAALESTTAPVSAPRGQTVAPATTAGLIDQALALLRRPDVVREHLRVRLPEIEAATRRAEAARDVALLDRLYGERAAVAVAARAAYGYAPPLPWDAMAPELLALAGLPIALGLDDALPVRPEQVGAEPLEARLARERAEAGRHESAS